MIDRLVDIGVYVSVISLVLLLVDYVVGCIFDA